MKKIEDKKKANKLAKVLSCLGLALVLISGILIVASSEVRGEDNAADKLYCRPELPDGKPHTDKLIRYKAEVTLSETKVLIVTSGHGPLTGISPEEEKDYWMSRLVTMGYSNVDWYDGIPTFDLLNQYDLVIYDAGGYWYPLSNEVEPLWEFHFTGKPLIIVAPDINYDWENIKASSKPTFCEDIMHISGVLGILPEVSFEVIANTGHEIIVSVPTGLEIPVASQSSYPDCFDPAPGCDGVLTQGYITNTEFGVGSCSDLPSYAPYDPLGSLFSVVAYPGSDSEGRAVLFGFPPTAIEQSNILDLLAEGTINWALAQEKPADIELTLYIEDATTPKGAPAIVNKAPGDKIDVVAVVVNKEESSQTVVVELSVPTELGDPEKVIIRSNFSPQSEIRENLPLLSVPLTDLEPGEIQVVWRFEISDSASPQSTIVQAEARVGDVLCAASAGGFRILDRADAIIVTNRYLLYGNYDDDEVGSLLRYLFQISEWGNTISKKNCIVYYVDHYDADLEDWDQDVDYSSENKANEVANDIDNLIEDWDDQTNPDYLMIVGGDEVIPFYRKDTGILHNEEINHAGSYPADDPVLNTFRNDYYLTDTKYADVGDVNWEKGEVELSTGRIVGASARDMESFINHGISGPSKSCTNAVVASRYTRDPIIPGNNNDMVDALRGEKNFNILNDNEIPLTIQNDAWTADDLIDAMRNGFAAFGFFGHGEYFGIEAPAGGVFIADVIDEVNDNDCISSNRPLFDFASCRVGVVRGNNWNDCMCYALVNQGASAIIACPAIHYSNDAPNQISWGEKLSNDFFQELITGASTTKPFGLALRNVKVNYDAGLMWSYTEKKTVIMYTLYGIPWATMDPQESLKIEKLEDTDNSVSVNLSDPIFISDNDYARIIEINVTDYNVSNVNGFDIIEINGSELSFEEDMPTIPVVKVALLLPFDANVTKITMVDNVTMMIGYYDIPSIVPSMDIAGAPRGGYVATSDELQGFYPSPIYSIDISTLDDYKLARITIALIQYNPQTDETILYNYTKLELTYQTPTLATITDFSPEKTEYTSGDAITTSITIENVGSDALTGLYVNLSLVDPYGQVKTSGITPSFDVAPGESRTISVELDQSLAHGSYTAEMNLINSTGDVLGSSSEQIYISTGEITDFILPSEVKSGEDITFNITFENKNTMDVEANGVVYIYDPNDIEIAQLPSLPVTVAPDSAEQISISWSTVGKEIGAYKAVAYVFANEESFSSEYRAFEIKSVAADVVIFRNGRWWISKPDHTGTDYSFNYGIPGDIPVVGDVNNDGVDDVVIFRNGRWWISKPDHTGTDYSFNYGIPGDIPVVGDVNNDGVDDVVIFRNGKWWVCKPDHTGTDYSFNYGIPGDIPVIGDVNNDGVDDVVIFRNGKWWVCKSDHTGTDYSFNYGIPGDIPVIGDVNNDGVDDVVIFRNGKWWVCKPDHTGTDYSFNYGIPGDKPVVGDIG